MASGLDWMNANVYTTNATEYDNWFHWEISGPQDLNNTIVLLYPALSGTQISNYLAAMDRYQPRRPGRDLRLDDRREHVRQSAGGRAYAAFSARTRTR